METKTEQVKKVVDSAMADYLVANEAEAIPSDPYELYRYYGDQAVFTTWGPPETVMIDAYHCRAIELDNLHKTDVINTLLDERKPLKGYDADHVESMMHAFGYGFLVCSLCVLIIWLVGHFGYRWW